MARMRTYEFENEDSEEELPSLADLVGKSKARAPTTSTTSRRGKPMSAKTVDESSTRRNAEVEPARPTTIKKKRVLNSRDDNPLLRPLDRTMKKVEKGEGREKRERSVRVASSELRGGRNENTEPQPEMTGRTKVSDVSKVKSRSTLPLGKTIVEATKPKPIDKPTREIKAQQTRPQEPEPASGTESGSHYDSDGLSDFVMDDDSLFQEEDSEVQMPPPPPRSTRRLVQGRRMGKEESDDDLDFDMKRLTIKDDLPKQKSKEVSHEMELKTLAADFTSEEDFPVKKRVPKKLFEDVRIEPPRRTKEPVPQKKCEPSSDLEDPFTLRYSPSENKPKKMVKETRFSTPPGSPEPKAKPRGLQSPTKKFAKIPSTPHRQSTDTFWQQDVINDWNDQYSPRKTPKPQSKPTLFNPEAAALLTETSPHKPTKEAKAAKKAFDARKHELAASFLVELDTKITNGQISALSASTGGVKILWSKKLNTTAGRANWKRETIRTTSTTNHISNPTQRPQEKLTHRHHAAIELAEKVIDDEHRLLNVLAHEFCHLANFMISNIKTNPHGKEFKEWGRKCSTIFKSRGVEVTTKHSYEIDYKFIWECGSCGLGYKRHSRSIDPKRHLCGSCKGRLVQVKPVPKKVGGSDGKGEEGKGGDWAKKVGEYQLFVKENMGAIRKENPGSPQKEIMGLVGKRYQEFKASRLREKVAESVRIEEDGVGGEDEEVGEEEVDELEVVARKLNFVDLSGDSP